MKNTILVLSLEDYDDSCNNETYYFEDSYQGFATALDKIKFFEKNYYTGRTFHWENEPRYDEGSRHLACKSWEEEVYYLINRVNIWTSKKIELE